MAPSQSTSPATAGFCSLPREIRENIYKAVLIVDHPLYLFGGPGSRVESFAPDKPFRWLALLYMNRQIYNEARVVLYNMNSFTLMDTTQHQADLLQCFLDCIGPRNASLLSHLCINFPLIEGIKDQPETVKLSKDSLQSLKLLEENFASLTTLETLIHGGKYTGLIKACQYNSAFVREALSHIDTHIKAVSSLNRFIIRIYDRSPMPSVIESMRGLGWIVLLSDEK